jgi:hypothetical protein
LTVWFLSLTGIGDSAPVRGGRRAGRIGTRGIREGVVGMDKIVFETSKFEIAVTRAGEDDLVVHRFEVRAKEQPMSTKIKNPDGKMTIDALFYQTVKRKRGWKPVTVVDNTSGELHRAGEVLFMSYPDSPSDAQIAVWELEQTLRDLGLSLEVVVVGRK